MMYAGEERETEMVKCWKKLVDSSLHIDFVLIFELICHAVMQILC